MKTPKSLDILSELRDMVKTKWCNLKSISSNQQKQMTELWHIDSLQFHHLPDKQCPFCLSQSLSWTGWSPLTAHQRHQHPQ